MRLPKFRSTVLPLLTLTGLAIMLLPFLAHAITDWGPQNRPTFTWANPSTFITFNSITDNPTAGDERHFYTANQVGVDTHTKSLPVTDGEEVTLRAYVHNDAAQNLNLVAHNTRIKMTIPTGEATDQSSFSYISADNSNPTQVWDSLHLTSSTPFSVAYEAGSAKMFNNVFGSGTALSDSIVTDSGAPLGYDKIDGNLPGCAKFSAWVTIRVKVHMKQTPPPKPTPPPPAPTPTPPAPTPTPPAPTPTPPAPTPTVTAAPALVNTGPGSLIGLFLAVGGAAAIAFRYLLIRRLGSKE